MMLFDVLAHYPGKDEIFTMWINPYKIVRMVALDINEWDNVFESEMCSRIFFSDEVCVIAKGTPNEIMLKIHQAKYN